MDLRDFQDLLDRHGGDPRAWPADRRAKALALVESSADAYRLLEEMRQVEAMLVIADAPEPSPDAMTRVMDRIRDHENQLADAAARSGSREPAGMAGAATARAVLREVRDTLGGLVYRPVILFATVSLVGILIGVADRAVTLQQIQGQLLFFM